VFCDLNCRAHDRNIIQKVNTYLKDHDTKGLDITIGRFHSMLNAWLCAYCYATEIAYDGVHGGFACSSCVVG
jgi:hypothetical protein